MIDRSNPITDILVKAITDFVIVESKGTADTENVKARIETAAQALYEAVVAALPEKDLGSEPPGTSRKAVQIGYNLATDQARRSLANLFGISKEGEQGNE